MSATLGARRGLEDAVRALAKLPETARLTIFGRMQPAFEPEFLSLVEQLGVTARITIKPIPEPSLVMSTISRFDVGLSLDLNDSLNRSLTICNKVFLYLQAGLLRRLRLTRQGSAKLSTARRARVSCTRQAMLTPSRPGSNRSSPRAAGSSRRKRRHGRPASNGTTGIVSATYFLAAVREALPPTRLAAAGGGRIMSRRCPRRPGVSAVQLGRRTPSASVCEASAGIRMDADGADGQAGTDRRSSRPDARTAARSGIDHRANRGDTHQAVSTHRRSGPSIVARARPGADLDDRPGPRRALAAVRATVVLVRARSDDETAVRRPVCRGLHRPVDHRAKRHASVSGEGLVLPSRRRGHRTGRAAIGGARDRRVRGHSRRSARPISLARSRAHVGDAVRSGARRPRSRRAPWPHPAGFLG